MDTINYKTSGVCSRNIEIVIEDDVIVSVRFAGGCNGNLQGIGRLVEGKNAKEVATLLKGVNCNGKGTSCPDQLSKAIEKYYSEKA